MGCSICRVVMLVALACLVAMALPASGLAAVSTGDGVWTWQNPLPQGNVLGGGFFLDGQEGWLVGARGTLIHTLDGGASWDGQISNTVFDLTSVWFVDRQHGWAVGNRPLGLIWHGDSLPPAIIATSDGGATWHGQSTGIYGIQNQANTTLNSVRFVDDQHGWAVGVYWHDGAYHALILATGDGGAHWVQQGPRTIGLTLWDVDFADALHGWAVGQTNAGPSILVTSDGGATWRFQETTAGTLFAVDFLDSQEGWAVGSFGTTVHTTDGGATWTMGSLGTSENLNGVSFSDAAHGVIVGWDKVYRTSDGGLTWTSQDVSPSDVTLTTLVPADATHSWILGKKYVESRQDCYVLSTKDGGDTWDPPTSYETADLNDVSFVDRAHGWAVGAAGTILATDDGGGKWSRQDSGTTQTLNAVDFIDPQAGWAAGSYGIVATNDGGLTWHEQPSPLGAYEDVCFVDALHGWAVGGGAVVRTSDGGVTWTANQLSTTGGASRHQLHRCVPRLGGRWLPAGMGRPPEARHRVRHDGRRRDLGGRAQGGLRPELRVLRRWVARLGDGGDPDRHHGHDRRWGHVAGPGHPR